MSQRRLTFTFLSVAFSAVSAANCGGTADIHPEGDGPAEPTESLASTRQAYSASAAQTTATTNAKCTALSSRGAWYVEIGDGSGVLWSSSPTGGRDATTVSPIASASKWLYAGARIADGVSVTSKQLNFTSGWYTASLVDNIEYCYTVSDCYTNNKVTYSANKANKFNYDSGHMLRELYTFHSDWNSWNLASNGAPFGTGYVNSKLGLTIPYYTAHPAGGFQASAEQYRVYLKDILNNATPMRSALGANQVCAHKQNGCNALNSPAADAGHQWNYSVGHWVELDQDSGYSSPGMWGFYPYVNPNQGIYQVLSRYDTGYGKTGGVASAECAYRIRTAFLTGSAVTW